MSIFRADLYLQIKLKDFNLLNSSEKLFAILKEVSYLRNIQMTKVRQDKEEQGKVVINERYEITGSIDVPEGSKSFWALSKEFSQNEPYNVFMRIDRNIEAKDYDMAQKKAFDWISKTLVGPIKEILNVESIEVDSPTMLRKKAKIMRESY
jgi:hypothetical protein